MDALHFSSKPDIAVLRPERHGTGVRGAERKRKEQHPDSYLNRVYLYETCEGRPVMREHSVQSQRYCYRTILRGERFYDLDADPDGIIPAMQERGVFGS